MSTDHTNRPDDLISIASIDNEKEFCVVNLEELSEDRNWKFVRNYLVNFLDRAIDKRFSRKIKKLVKILEAEYLAQATLKSI